MIFNSFVLAYNEKVVAFLKQDGIANILKTREAEYPNKGSLQYVIFYLNVYQSYPLPLV